MKSLLVIVISLIIQITYSQKIKEIDYGTAYLDLKEMSYFDYKDNCGGYYCRGTLEGILTSRGNYACSKFKNQLIEKDYEIGNMYSDHLVSLIGDFEKVKYRKMWKDFSNCSEKSFKYVKLLLEKFEIISEYYKDLYNYKVEKKLMKNEINKTTKSIDEKFDNEIVSQKRRFVDDSLLNNLIAQKEKSINDMNLKFDEKINEIKRKRDNEIESLSMQNYSSNKDDIIEESRVKIKLVNKEKTEAINSANLFWDDKISFRKKKLKEEIANEIEKLSNKGVTSKKEERKNIIGAKNLDDIRVNIENEFEEEIKEVESKITKLINEK